MQIAQPETVTCEVKLVLRLLTVGTNWLTNSLSASFFCAFLLDWCSRLSQHSGPTWPLSCLVFAPREDPPKLR